jgi:predicted cupin superfamily sugar epimerase
LGEKGHEILPLGPVSENGAKPQHLVPSKTIFGSTVDQSDSYALVSCVVAPGFDFRDFELFTADDLLPLYPKAEEIIRKLT